MNVLLGRSLFAGRCPAFKKIFQSKNTLCNQRYFSHGNKILKQHDKTPLSAIPLKTSCVRLLLTSFSHKRHIFTSNPCYLPTNLPFDVKSEVSEDTLIYSNDNSRFYKLLTFFGFIQFFFWVHLATFSYSTLRDVKPQNQEVVEDVHGQPWWKKINLGENKFRNGIALLCISVGYVVMFISIIYPRRSVKQLWLLKGGRATKITTFGYKSNFVCPLSSISCLQQRSASTSQLPLKMKGKWFYFLMDKKGVFHEEKLFDFCIGLKRNLNEK
ncbi:transmembrane protein 223-like [Argonauta hians]